MSLESSFKLRPSNSGAFSSYVEGENEHIEDKESSGIAAEEHRHHQNNTGTRLEEAKTEKAAPLLFNCVNAYSCPSETVVDQRVASAAVLPDWQESRALPRFTTANSNHFRASQLDLLLHRRYFPNNGAISPIQKDDVGRGKPDRLDPQNVYSHPPFWQRPLHNSHERNDIRLIPDPPVAEIRIPTPQEADERGEDSNDDDALSLSIEDYKTRYYVSQRDLHSTQEYLAYAQEENRLLKRKLIELQRRLYEDQRNKRPCLSHHTLVQPMWSIPETKSMHPHPNKRPMFRMVTSIDELDAAKPETSTIRNQVSSQDSA